jgi:hypothetical protein
MNASALAISGTILEVKMKLSIFAISALCIASTSAFADCKSDLDAMTKAMMHAGPYHMSMTSDRSGKTTKMEADVILPTSEHMKMDQMEIVILPQGAWMKTGGSWHAAPGPMAANMLTNMMSNFKGERSNIVCGSNEDFDGHSYPVYKYDSAGDVMGIKTSSHITLYIGDKGLPVGLIVDGTAMGVHSVTT